MSGQSGLVSELNEEAAFSPSGEMEGSKKPQEIKSKEDRETTGDGEGLKEDEDEEEAGEEKEEMMTVSALLEPSTLPWPGDKRLQPEPADGIGSETGVSEPEEVDTGTSAGSQDLSEGTGRAESGGKIKSKWRESMPEGERWRDDLIELQQGEKGDGSLADDEEEEEEEEEEANWASEKAGLGFTPQVMIVRPSGKELPEESKLVIEKDFDKEPQAEADSEAQVYADWNEHDKYYPCERMCSQKLRLALATAAGGLLFPLLVWAGYMLLPFDSPPLQSAPLRVVYTLRCTFFAIIPILLGVVVQGVARLRHNVLTPLYRGTANREVAVHWHYVNESLGLFLFFFVQLVVMATYVSQELVKLVPLLTITFVFGRLIYWLCLSLGSSMRGFGFSFSFFPILVLLGANLYFVCSSVGPEAVFDVEPPTPAPPPRQRWWG